MPSAGASRKPRTRLVRGLYLLLGLACLGLASVSFLPGIPTVDLLVLAAFFFARSSDRLHAWLVDHPVLGRMIRGYRLGLTRGSKVAATLGIVSSLSLSGLLLTESAGLRTVLALVGIWALWYVWTRPLRERTPSRVAGQHR